VSDRKGFKRTKIYGVAVIDIEDTDEVRFSVFSKQQRAQIIDVAKTLLDKIDKVE